jgi:hypothetical protein
VYFHLREGRVERLRIGDVSTHSEYPLRRLPRPVRDRYVIAQGDEGLSHLPPNASISTRHQN